VNPLCWSGTEHRVCSGIVTVEIPLILPNKLSEDFGRVGRFNEFDHTFGNHRRIAVLQRKRYRRVGSQIAHLDRVGSRANPEFSEYPYEPNRHQVCSSIGTDGGHPNVRLIPQSLFNFGGWIRSHDIQSIATQQGPDSSDVRISGLLTDLRNCPKIKTMKYETRAPEDLGSAVAEFRAVRGLTQAELAKRTDLHRTYLSGVESGVVPEYVRRYFTLLHALGLKLEISER
jgi:DNA-binding XRE family transcriptional regulator